MLKEIYEQKQVVLATVNYVRTLHEQLVAEGSASFTLLKNASCFASVACGTSLHAAKLSEFFFEYVAQIPVASWCASELRSRYYIDTKPVVFAISQSGETADTLEAMRILLERGMAVIGITNTPKSSLSRESTYQLFTQSTREISVAATKTFTAQVALLYWLAHAVAVAKSTVPIGALERAEQELLQVGYQMQELLEEYKAQLTQWARTYARYDRFMTIGRQASYPLAQECALKLKEITYKMVDCYPAGELKHGALALIDEQTPTIVFSVLDAVSYQKLLGNVQEIKARGGRVLAFAFASQAELIALADEVLIAPVVPHLLGSLVLTGVMHYFSYQVAVVLDRPIDKPRNLAKSVTIE
jgi:glucosamine--fructose-6-phosphate aminotransferase (isomerizing)